MWTKPIWQSKTVWASIAAAGVVEGLKQFGIVLNVEQVSTAFVLVATILRRVSSDRVTFTGQ
jgi:hypothetical protein